MPGAVHNSIISLKDDVPPTALFSYVVNNLTISTDASDSDDTDGAVISYAWNFGDGVTATGLTVTHTYAGAGTYSVTLTATDNGGAQGTQTKSVTVSTPAIPAFTLGTTKPSAANTGYAANGLSLAGLGQIGTITSAVAPGSGSPGANSSPQNVPGIYTVAANSTLDGYTVNGDVVLMAGATLSRCIIHGRVIDFGGGCLIENNEIDGYASAATYTSASIGGVMLYQNLRPAGTPQSTVRYNRIHARVATTASNGIAFRNFYAYRNEVFDVVDGIDYAASTTGNDPNVLIEGNYIHDLMQITPDSAHSDNVSHCDGTQLHGNASGTPVSITGNYYESTYSSFTNTNFPSYENVSCLMINDDIGVPNIVVNKNWFYGAQVMINGQGSPDAIGTFTNNRFDTSNTPGYAAWFKPASQTNITWSGNLDQNGATVTPLYS